MNAIKDEILRRVEARARREAEWLAGEFARAASSERETILAALETERWLAQACHDCAPLSSRRRRRF